MIARVAKLVDAPGLGPDGGNTVPVRVRLRAPNLNHGTSVLDSPKRLIFLKGNRPFLLSPMHIEPGNEG